MTPALTAGLLGLFGTVAGAVLTTWTARQTAARADLIIGHGWRPDARSIALPSPSLRGHYCSIGRPKGIVGLRGTMSKKAKR